MLCLGMMTGACAARQETPPSSPVEGAPAPQDDTQQEASAVATKLTCTLSGPALVRTGEPVELVFQLSNPTAKPVRVLTWHTPLEGVLNKIFDVSRDNTALEYRGPMAKRAPPTASSYITLEPGASAEGKVDAARYYDLRAPGTYRIAFRGPLMDVAQEGQPVPAPNGEYRATDVSCPTVQITITP
ncbi:Extracellular protease precursor [Myxococcus hansupus]|uniref:Extracellular protease n=1 Tax=Pseudomyxococcus hansupus TaxID=1297742 RepID=A0A0H4WQ44_9BACT|nr:Extracellular protease precursor [Myxococcus hansupus]